MNFDWSILSNRLTHKVTRLVSRDLVFALKIIFCLYLDQFLCLSSEIYKGNPVEKTTIDLNVLENEQVQV